MYVMQNQDVTDTKVSIRLDLIDGLALGDFTSLMTTWEFLADDITSLWTEQGFSILFRFMLFQGGILCIHGGRRICVSV